MKRPDSELTKLGDLPLAKSLAKKYAPTRAKMKLLDQAAELAAAPDDVERAYMARQLVQCTLPHSDPKDGAIVWQRKSGGRSLVIQSGYDDEKGEYLGIPYGTIPRLLLFWLVTEANYKKNLPDLTEKQRRHIELGRSLAAFMRAVGLNPETGGGKRGDAYRLRVQMLRLFSSRITFQGTVETEEAKGKIFKDMSVTTEYELWWDVKAPGQGTLFPSYLDLGEKFYDAITTMPVPFDLRALRMLHRSPLALDLYALLAYQAFAIVTNKRQPQFLSWTVLMRQLGTGISDTNNFKKKVQKELRKVRLAYPGLAVESVRGGLSIHASRLAVPKKTVGDTAPPDTQKRPR